MSRRWSKFCGVKNVGNFLSGRECRLGVADNNSVSLLRSLMVSELFGCMIFCKYRSICREIYNGRYLLTPTAGIPCLA